MSAWRTCDACKTRFHVVFLDLTGPHSLWIGSHVSFRLETTRPIEPEAEPDGDVGRVGRIVLQGDEDNDSSTRKRTKQAVQGKVGECGAACIAMDAARPSAWMEWRVTRTSGAVGESEDGHKRGRARQAAPKEHALRMGTWCATHPYESGTVLPDVAGPVCNSSIGLASSARLPPSLLGREGESIFSGLEDTHPLHHPRWHSETTRESHKVSSD